MLRPQPSVLAQLEALANMEWRQKWPIVAALAPVVLRVLLVVLLTVLVQLGLLDAALLDGCLGVLRPLGLFGL